MCRMLVVDDDELIVDLVKTILTRAGYKVTAVNCGQDALDLLDREAFDVVVSDIFMPKGTGIELLVKMRSRGIDTGFVAISGGHFAHFSPFATALQSMGVTTTLQKPFAPGELLAAVNTALPHPKAVA